MSSTASRNTGSRRRHYDNGWIRSSSDPTLTDPGNPDRQVYDQTIDYSYDARGNQTLWHSRGFSEGRSEGRKIQREFWPSGLLRERTGLKPVEGADDVARRSYSYSYNENRSLTQVTDRLPQGSPVDQAVRETRIVRDGAEREAAVDEQWASGRDTAYSYDADGNVTERRTDGDYSGGSYAGGKTTAFTFDALGRETRMEVSGAGDARTVESSYYPSSQVAERTRWVAGNPAVEEAFAYRSDGLIAEMMRQGGSGNSKDQAYAYDPNGNRTRDERGTHSFNARDQLVLWERGGNQPDPGTHVSYVLNGSGAIERELDDGETTTYRYNGERLLSAEDDETRSSYFYDDFGNVRRISTQSRLDNGVFPDAPAPPSPGYACEQEIQGWTEASDTYYCYDEFERLGASQGPGQDGESYVHDGLDRRDLKLTRDGGARISEYSYVGTSESLAREQRTDGGSADYDYSATGERMGQRLRDAGTDEFHPYAKDANGSVEALEQDDGSIAEADRYPYDPYGELEDPNEDNDQDADSELGADAESNPFRFEGFYYDSAIKTYDMQAREYRPDVGRFLSADRFEAAGTDLALQSDPLTQNRYAFAGGNPVSRIEWDGHWACSGWECGSHDHGGKGGGGNRGGRGGGGSGGGGGGSSYSVGASVYGSASASAGAKGHANTDRRAVERFARRLSRETPEIQSDPVDLTGLLPPGYFGPTAAQDGDLPFVPRPPEVTTEEEDAAALGTLKDVFIGDPLSNPLDALALAPTPGKLVQLGRGVKAGLAGTRLVKAAHSDLVQEAATTSARIVGPGRGPVHGTRVHTAFRDQLRALGRDDVRAEVSFLSTGEEVASGTPGSVRVDVITGSADSPTAIYDLKTGAAQLTDRRVNQIRSHLPPEWGQSIPILPVRP